MGLSIFSNLNFSALGVVSGATPHTHKPLTTPLAEKSEKSTVCLWCLWATVGAVGRIKTCLFYTYSKFNKYKTIIGVAEKKGVVGPQLYADYAVLDGDLTLSLPPKVCSFYLLCNVKLYVQ